MSVESDANRHGRGHLELIRRSTPSIQPVGLPKSDRIQPRTHKCQSKGCDFDTSSTTARGTVKNIAWTGWGWLHVPLSCAAARTPVVDTLRTERANVVASARRETAIVSLECVRHTSTS